eukprot:Colp12_sorted_trinity150504_noHs@20327
MEGQMFGIDPHTHVKNPSKTFTHILLMQWLEQKLKYNENSLCRPLQSTFACVLCAVCSSTSLILQLLLFFAHIAPSKPEVLWTITAILLVPQLTQQILLTSGRLVVLCLREFECWYLLGLTTAGAVALVDCVGYDERTPLALSLLTTCISVVFCDAQALPKWRQGLAALTSLSLCLALLVAVYFFPTSIPNFRTRNLEVAGVRRIGMLDLLLTCFINIAVYQVTLRGGGLYCSQLVPVLC